MMRAGVYLFAFVLGVGAMLFPATLARALPPPRYAKAVEQELQSMDLHPTCEAEAKQRFHCTYETQTSIAGRKLVVNAVYSDQTDTIYFYIERYLVSPADGAKTPALLQRLMELNWELLVGKLEWNPRSGEVRLSAVLSTDSNFDRRAFRSVAHALEVTAARYDRELRALTAGP